MRIENPVDITDQKALIDGILAESLQAAAARGHAALTAAITRYLGCDDWATIDIATRMQSIHYIDGIVEYHIDGKRLLMVLPPNIKPIINIAPNRQTR